MQTFLSEYLTYDPATRRAYQGKDRVPLSPEGFYSQLGRPDLVGEVVEREQTQRIFFGCAIGAAVVGVGGSLWISLSPPPGFDPNTQAILSASLIAAGLVGAGLLVGIALRTDLDPVTSAEDEALANQHNAEPRRRLGITAPATPPVSWSWTRMQLSWK
jgi:hypothetical protein